MRLQKTMTNPRQIIDALLAASDPVVLASVVRITGSSYGGVGTRMLIQHDGSTIGLVSGGCLEADLAEHARQVRVRGEARVVTYDTRADDETAWGLGLGCNGLIDILLEPLGRAAAKAMAGLLEAARSASDASVLATVIAGSGNGEPATGSHVLLTDDGILTTGDWRSDLIEKISRDLHEGYPEQRRGMVRQYDQVTIAFEVMNPAIRLVICGSGPDVVPLVRFASDLGWSVTVVDHRSLELAHPERFPGAHVVDCTEPGNLSQRAALSSRTAAVVMSHNYARDLGYLEALLASSAGYIGMLGPRARTERMLADLAAAGKTHRAVERLFAPVGLDTGGEGPDAIALAIVAEVSAVMSGSTAGHLRDRPGALHEAGAARSRAG